MTRLRIEPGTSRALCNMANSDSMPLLGSFNGSNSLYSSSMSMDRLSQNTTFSTLTDCCDGQQLLPEAVGAASNAVNVNDTDSSAGGSQLIVISGLEPSRQRPRPRPRARMRAGELIAGMPVSPKSQLKSADDSSDNDTDEEDEEHEDEDEITDYLAKLGLSPPLPGLSQETLPGTAALGRPEIPGRPQAVNRGSNVNVSVVDINSPQIPNKTRISHHNSNEQDTISDESGYSEETQDSKPENLPEGLAVAPEGLTISPAGLSLRPLDLDLDLDSTSTPQVNGGLANGTIMDLPLPEGYNNKNETSEPEPEGEEDLTVTGVMITDFSPTERMRFLQRSRSSAGSKNSPAGQSTDLPSWTGSPVQEFCINI